MKYIAPEDIHVYSIDEVFLDVTQYLKTYGMTARELASRNVCVNAVAPGFIRTDMTDKLPEAVQDNAVGQIPLKKMGRPEDVAQAVLFLAGDASDYITGQVLCVDGGMAM